MQTPCAAIEEKPQVYIITIEGVPDLIGYASTWYLMQCMIRYAMEKYGVARVFVTKGVKP